MKIERQANGGTFGVIGRPCEYSVILLSRVIFSFGPSRSTISHHAPLMGFPKSIIWTK